MSSIGVASTAGRRQFNDTAINKLMAEGVNRAVATAFVSQGIDKSGQYNQLRDHVCKMEYVQYLLPRTVNDYKDPLRVGQLAPYVQDLNMPRFHTEFAMNDIEAAKFAASFPEFNVVARGSTYNQHAFYANKRYAEAELLVGLVYEHSRRHGGLWDPTRLVDLGGNDTWHAKKQRKGVHCDNPVLSVRDVARYKVREVFSGSGLTGVTTCRHTFLQCDHSADYAIAVHATYDITPRSVAMGMHKRKIKCLFLCMITLPGIDRKPDGQYEVDGVVATLQRNMYKELTIRYTFRHDPALEYSHKFSTLRAYLYTHRTYDFTLPSGEVVSYHYSVHSMRGNTLVAKIERVDGPTMPVPDAMWTPSRRKCYYLSIGWLDVRDLELDVEFFDRLVMEATGSRAADQYDIVSLFRYAKSLRQRVSINGVVLSSGYTMNPDHLVAATVGAYAVAAAYRVEGAAFFKKASSQISIRRSQGFVRDVLRVVGTALVAPFELLASAMMHYTFYNVANEKLKAMIVNASPVEIVLDKPHGVAGMGFNPALLKPSPKLNADGKYSLVESGESHLYTPLMIGGYDAPLVPQEVFCAGLKKVFLSYGIPVLGKHEVPMESKPTYHDVSVYPEFTPVKSEEYRSKAYRAVLPLVVNPTAFDAQPLVLANGDRLFRKRMYSLVDRPSLPDPVGSMVRDSDVYVVFRGVGSRAVVLARPPLYSKGTCLAFVLLFEDEVSDRVRMLKAGKVVGIGSADVARAVTKQCVEAGVGVAGLIVPGYVELPAGLDSAGLTSSDWEGVESGDLTGTTGGSSGTTTVAGGYYMAGARGPDTPAPSVAGSVEPVVRLSTPPGTALFVGVGSSEEPAVKLAESVSGLANPVGSLTGDAFEEMEGEARLFEHDVGSDDGGGFRSDRPGGLAVADEADAGESVDSGGVVWGYDAMQEMLAVCDASHDVALATGRQTVDTLLAVARSEAPMSMWGSIVQGVPGEPVPVKVSGDSFLHYIDGSELSHMAVTDGDVVYDRITNPPPDGVYVTSEVMRVYTGAAIRDSIASVAADTYRCLVTNVDGVAGSGKTYTIVHEASVGDVVLCETRGALCETARELEKKSGWSGHAYTVDAFLMHRQVGTCDTLWIDESLRLHAAKIFAVVKLLRPNRAFCFGDAKQIAALPFVPGFEFAHHKFPFTTVKTVRDTWRSPADVCLITSRPEYYGFEVRTHNQVKRSVLPLKLFEQGMFQSKPSDVQLVVYTQVVKHDLLAAGVRGVITIGESQGNTFDKLWLYRDSTLGKALYYDAEQALVGITRHRLEFQYVTSSPYDDSRLARNIRWLHGAQTDLLLASRLLAPARGVRAGRVMTDFGSPGEPVEELGYASDEDWAGPLV